MVHFLQRHNRFVGFFFGLTLFTGIVFFLSGTESLEALSRIRVSHFIFITFVTLAINCVRALRWKMLLSVLGIADIRYRVLFENLMLATLTGHAFSNIIGDLAVRIQGLNHEKVSVGGVLVSVAAEKTFEVLLLLSVLAAWFFFLFTGIGEAHSNYYGLLIVGALLVFASMIPFKVAFWWAKKIKREIEGNAFIFPGFLPGFQVAGLSIIKYLLVSIRYGFVFWMLGVTLEPLEVFYGTSFSQLGIAASITPGGIGLVEAGWTGYLAFLETAPDSIASFLIVQRVLTTICVLFATLIVFILKKYSRKMDG